MARTKKTDGTKRKRGETQHIRNAAELSQLEAGGRSALSSARIAASNAHDDLAAAEAACAAAREMLSQAQGALTEEEAAWAALELRLLVERLAKLPADLLKSVLRPLPGVELARLSRVHKAFRGTLKDLRKEPNGRRLYGRPKAADIKLAKGLGPLRRAAFYGDVAVLQKRLSAGVDKHGTPLLEIRDAKNVRIVDRALSQAAERGHIQALQLLIGFGADMYASDDEALRLASGSGHADVVALLLKHVKHGLGAMDPDDADDDADDDDPEAKYTGVHTRGDEALRKASRSGHDDVVELLLQHGANVRANQDEALYWACLRGRADMVATLFQHGANAYGHVPNMYDRDWEDKWGNVLLAASENGHADVVALLLQHGADIDGTDEDHCDDYPLTAAVRKGHAAVVSLLLQHGANANAEAEYVAPHDPHGTPLTLASESGNLDIVQLLLQHGADVNVEMDGDYYMSTPLALASKHGHLDVLQLLLQHGADVHTFEDWALLEACNHGHVDVVQLLIKHGADVNAVDTGGGSIDYDDAFTPLGWACHGGHTDVALLLLQHGADVHAEGNEALMQAAQHDHADLVSLLLQHGADLNAQDGDGESALIRLSGYGDADAVLLLNRGVLQHGADLHFANDGALRSASEWDHEDVVQLLIEHGPVVHADSDAALKVATEKSHTAVIELLIQHGAHLPTA